MMLDPRLAVYLFRVAQRIHKGIYVEALLKCPECGGEVTEFDQDEADRHVVIQQKIGDKLLYYVVVGCEGYWVVDPQTLGIPRGNWSPTHEIVKQRLEKYAQKKMGWDLQALALEEDNRKELAGIVKDDPHLDQNQKRELLSGLGDDQ